MPLKKYDINEHIKTFSNDELKKYYDCYSHHHFNRFNCSNVSSNVSSLNESSCRCVCDKDHYCTSNSALLDESANVLEEENHSTTEWPIYVCEHFRPSFTSKQEQLSELRRDIYELKKSKHIMRQTMKELDAFLDENKSKSDDHLDDVEKFYRSDKFIGSSMNIRKIKDCVDRTRPKAKYMFEINNLSDANKHFQYPHGNALFAVNSKLNKKNAKKLADLKLNQTIIVSQFANSKKL